MKAKEKFDYMFRRIIANLPVTPENIRTDFKNWWRLLCKEIDKNNQQQAKDIFKDIEKYKRKFPASKNYWINIFYVKFKKLKNKYTK